MQHALMHADRYLKWLDMALAAVAAMAIFAMMLITALDVVMRYAFNAPLEWVFDLTTHYLLIAGFFLGLSYALRMNHHICVDFFARRLPPRFYHPFLAVGSLAAGFVFAWVASLGAQEAFLSWANGDVMFGAVIWPTWPGKAVIPLGMAPLGLRSLHRALAHMSAVLDSRWAHRFEIGIDSHVVPEE